MRKSFFVLLLLLSLLGLAHAQDLSEVYSFVDGTTINFPSDFLVFNEEYDGLTMANSQTEIAVKVLFARNIEAQRLQTLPQILEYYFAANPEIYTIGAEEAILIGERDAIRFVHEVTDENPHNEIYIALSVGDNGSAAVLRIQPNLESGVFELSEEALALEIAASLHFEDIRGDLSTAMGNSFPFEDGLIIEYRDTWVADATSQSLTSAFAKIFLIAFTPEEIIAEDHKPDPLEILYYDLYRPNDTSLVFIPENIVIEPIRGREVVHYSFTDTVDGETVQRIILVMLVENGTFAALEIQTAVDLPILADPDTQDMLQTIRPAGSLPPVTMMALGSSFNLQSGASVRFPDYWRARSLENGVSLDSLEVNVFIQSFNTADAAQYINDLPAALLSLTQPLDSTVQLSADAVNTITLENEHTALQLSYTETTAERTYPRTVWLLRLDDESLVFVSVSPQLGISELTELNEAEVRAILNTISPR